MPGKEKINLEKIKASLSTLCTECGYKIPPAEERRIDSITALPKVWRGLHSGKGEGLAHAGKPQAPASIATTSSIKRSGHSSLPKETDPPYRRLTNRPGGHSVHACQPRTLPRVFACPLSHRRAFWGVYDSVLQKSVVGRAGARHC